MNKSLLSIAAASTVMFLLAGLYTGVLAKDFMAIRVNPLMLRTPINLALVFIGYVVLSALMTVLYARIVRVKSSPALNGLCFGMATGICWLMPYSLVLFGVYNFPYAALPLDFGWALIEQGVGGLVIGLIHRTSTNDSKDELPR